MNRLVPDERWEQMRARFIAYQETAAAYGVALALKGALKLSRRRAYDLPRRETVETGGVLLS